MKSSPMKSPTRKHLKSPVKKQVSFSDAVTQLIGYMYYGVEKFTYPPIQLEETDEREFPCPFEEHACSEQVLHYDEDCQTRAKLLFEDKKAQKTII